MDGISVDVDDRGMVEAIGSLAADGMMAANRRAVRGTRMSRNGGNRDATDDVARTAPAVPPGRLERRAAPGVFVSAGWCELGGGDQACPCVGGTVAGPSRSWSWLRILLSHLVAPAAGGGC